MEKILLDPAIVIPNPQHDDLYEFWEQFSIWCEDERLRLGEHAHALILSWCTETIWGTDRTSIPRPLEREITTTLGKIVSRPPISHDAPITEHTSQPTHVSHSPDLTTRLLSDIMGVCFHGNSLTVASLPHLWNPQGSSGTITTESSVTEFEFIHTPNSETNREKNLAVREYFDGSRIFIVGGRRCQNTMSDLLTELGIDEKRIVWIESELNKSPNNLKKRLSSIKWESDHLVLVWGRVGHDSTDHVQKACSASGYTLVNARFVSQILTELQGRACESIADQGPVDLE